MHYRLVRIFFYLCMYACAHSGLILTASIAVLIPYGKMVVVSSVHMKPSALTGLQSYFTNTHYVCMELCLAIAINLALVCIPRNKSKHL